MRPNSKSVCRCGRFDLNGQGDGGALYGGTAVPCPFSAIYWLYLHALRSMPASVAGSFFSLIPVFGVVGSFFFLGERLTPPQWLGAILILGAVMMLLRRNIVEPSIELAGRTTAIQRSKTLSMLDERQLDDIGLTRKQASELDRKNADRRKP